MMYGKRAIEPVAFNADEVAKAVGLSLRYVRELIAKGDIKSFKVGRRRLVSREALTEFVANGERL